MKPKTYYLVSLGCAKNTVDSASMMGLLGGAGYQPVDRPGKAEFLIVNTCGFIQPAREESLEELRRLASRKKPGQKVIAAGCLTQRYGEQIAAEVPGLDGILSTRRWMDILQVVEGLRGGKPPQALYHLPDVPDVGHAEYGVLRAAIQGSSAYLKIADGCRRPCAFCSIPLIKGTTVSRRPDDILREARVLQDLGIQEIILIAQDTTDYGHDLGMKDGLAGLLEQMTDAIPDVPWIRVMYAYPGYVTDRLISVMAERKQILPYLDMPLQHASPAVLQRMHRPANMDWVHRTVEKMRAALPDLALRSTFIVGYPGETEEDFQMLLDFLEEIQLDRVGAFPFSFEVGTTSEPLGDPIPREVKDERLERLMLHQEGISLQRNQAWVGRTIPVLVEGISDEISIGRSFRDAPEIDGMVMIEGRAEEGKIIPVQITGALVHDLAGRVALS